MSRAYDKNIVIQKLDTTAETWSDLFTVHAKVNTAKADNEYLNAGATRSQRSLMFEVRYFADLEQISLNTQLYRLVFRGVPYNIKGFDDFMLQHRTVKMLGESY